MMQSGAASAKGSIDVAKVADLARLRLDSQTQERLQRELSSIVGYVEQLSEVDVSGIEPLAHATPLVNVLREDAAMPSFPREAMLANAPGVVDASLIKVPKVLPTEEVS